MAGSNWSDNSIDGSNDDDCSRLFVHEHLTLTAPIRHSVSLLIGHNLAVIGYRLGWQRPNAFGVVVKLAKLSFESYSKVVT